ncbi:uncharacterized protein [Syngnathus scovelli]|uniref:uncharacterized protein isoform X2 n=1 Tax=Syngnathus scovelli TaxID=161590 RepID=UPI00211069EB|nr:uncharacterized protein LOC125971126 isoform X2 [Syngnathus scovelli]
MLPIEGGIHKALQVIHANGAAARLHVVSGRPEIIYARVGDPVSLPCCSSSSCSSVNCQRRRISETEVKDSQVLIISPISQRPSLKNDCLLHIALVTEEDAGFYRCKQDGHSRKIIELSVMTVKLLSPLDSDLMRDQNMVLECSQKSRFCRFGVLRWIGKQTSMFPIEWDKCVSRLEVLPVSRVSNYTCQFVKEGTVKVEVQYTAVFTEVDAGGPELPPDPKMLLINIIRIGVSLLILYIILVFVILVKRKSRRDAGQDRQS